MASILGCLRRSWNCLKYDNREITGWIKTGMSRAPVTIVAAIFTASGLLFLAESLDTDCDNTVDLGLFSLRISSVLSAAQTMEVVINIFMAPVFGALADASSNRKLLLIAANVIWAVCMVIAGVVVLFEASLAILWLFIIVDVALAVFYELALLLLFAYLPEIANSEELLTKVSARQYAIVNASQLLIAGIMVVVVALIPEDLFENDQPIVAIAHGFAILWFLYFFIPGVSALPSRNKRVESVVEGEAVKKNENPLKKIYATCKEIYIKYPQVGWFLGAWVFYFAGIISVTVLQVAYITEEFDFETSDVTFVGGILLFTSVIGAASAEILSKCFRLKTLLLGCISLAGVATLVAPFVLQGEEREVPLNETDGSANPGGCVIEIVKERQPSELASIMIYVMSAVIGVTIGFVYPLNVAIYALIIPGGDEATYFGLKTFGAKIMAWAPPLLFTIINESTENLQFAFGSLSIWFIISLPFICMMDVDKGMADVAHTLHKRAGGLRGSIVDPGKRKSIKEVMEDETKVVEAASPLHQSLVDLVGEEAVAEKLTKEEGQVEREADNDPDSKVSL